jgi:hypothetical protein
MMERQRRPVLGAVSGFFFGLFLGTTLLLFGVLPLNSAWLTMLPVIWLVLGAAWGFWAPFGIPPEELHPAHTGLVIPAAPDTLRPVVVDPAPPPAPRLEPPPAPPPGPDPFATEKPTASEPPEPPERSGSDAAP